MFSHYLTSALRSAKKDPSGFFINLIGLITGFVIFSFAFAFAHYEKNYDTFWENSDRILLPATGLPANAPFGADQFWAYFPPIADHAVDEFPDIEMAAKKEGKNWPVKIGNNNFTAKPYVVDPDFFKIFNFTFLAGSAEGLSTNPEATLLSRKEAIRFFGGVDEAMEQTFEVNGLHNVKVVGVFENVPENSHLVASFDGDSDFDMVLSSLGSKRYGTEQLWSDWGSISSNLQTYFLVKPGIDKTKLETDMTAFVRTHQEESMSRFFDRTILRELDKVNLNFWVQQGIPGLVIAQGVGTIILLIAVLNAISLNSAQMLSRTQEIGMRRVVGASRTDLISQFIAENILETLMALILSFGVLFALTPIISSLAGREFDILAMMSEGTALFLVFTAIGVGIISTSYPIFLLTGMARGFSLDRTLTLSHSSGWLRKGLAIIQFSLVSALILAVVIVERQNQHLIDSAEQFDGDRIISMQGLWSDQAQKNIDIIQARLESLPGVDMVSKSNLPPFTGNINISIFHKLEAQETDDSMNFQIISIDHKYIPLHGMTILAGRNFEKNRGDDELTAEELKEGTQSTGNILVNQTATRILGFTNPVDALGVTFIWGRKGEGRTVTVIGVMPDMRLGSVEDDVRAAVFTYTPSRSRAFSIRFRTAEDVDIEAVNETWRDLLPGVELAVQSLKMAQENMMRPFSKLFNIFVSVAVIALILASSGLYALSAYLAGARRLEVGVRKVMGANPRQIVNLFLMQFTKPIVIALFIGLPLGAWLMTEFYLIHFPIRVELNYTMPAIAAFITLTIGWGTVLMHVLKAAKTHPNEVLHYE